MPRPTKQSRGFRGGRYRGSGRDATNDNGRGRGSLGFMGDLLDFPVQMWHDDVDNMPDRGGYRGGGRGGRSFSRRIMGSATPSRGGADSPRRRGRGRGDSSDYQHQPRRDHVGGRGGSKLRHDAPLSKLLYGERPFLKPIIFVPSVHTRTLFEQEEELLQPQVEDFDEKTSHVPTADRVTRIFSGGDIPLQQSSASDEGAAEEVAEIEGIDFEDMTWMHEEVDTAATSTSRKVVENSKLSKTKTVEERFTDFMVDRSQHESAAKAMESLAHEEPARDVDFNINLKLTKLSVGPEPEQDKNDCENATPQMGFYIDSKPSLITASPQDNQALRERSEVVEPTSFYIDATPARTISTTAQNSKDEIIMVDRIAADALLGEDDEIIVYVAPHPRVTKTHTPAETAPSLPSTSILTGTTSTFSSTKPTTISKVVDNTDALSVPTPPAFDSVSFAFMNQDSSNASPRKQQPRDHPVFTAGERAKTKAKAWKKEARAARRRLERRAMFGSFGAIMSEAQLRGDEEQFGENKDPRWEERRRGDSDIDWGDTDQDNDGERIEQTVGVVDEVSNGVGAMELDSDIDVDAMKAFVKGMDANGRRHVTMDDIADEERMRLEDAQDGSRCEHQSGLSDSDDVDEEGSVTDEDDNLTGEEELMMGEPRHANANSSGDVEDYSSDDVEESPNAGFQARLERLRKNAQGKKNVDAHLLSDEEVSDDDFFDGHTRAEEDDSFIAHVEALLDKEGGLLSSADRKARKRMFRAVQNGDFSELKDDIGPTMASHKKDKKVPRHLQDLWDRDRAKKAEYKRARAQARLEAAADPLSNKKGGKKGRKAVLAAARLDPSILIPERIVDMVTVEQQIRRFLANISGKTTMALPPMNTESRKKVHELASAFNLKSVSKGKHSGRYTTLTKTTRSGIRINEWKVGRIINNDTGITPPSGGKGKHATFMPRQREGDEVGKAAPKIGETNIGFKMLASMGWSEGDRIGVWGGLAAPLTAVIKNTKLGLGANR